MGGIKINKNSTLVGKWRKIDYFPIKCQFLQVFPPCPPKYLSLRIESRVLVTILIILTMIKIMFCACSILFHQPTARLST
jgi:hypothetical protein